MTMANVTVGIDVEAQINVGIDVEVQINGGEWFNIFTKEAGERLPNFRIHDLARAGVAFGALDYYDSNGAYSNIKFRVRD